MTLKPHEPQRWQTLVMTVALAILAIAGVGLAFVPIFSLALRLIILVGVATVVEYFVVKYLPRLRRGRQR